MLKIASVGLFLAGSNFLKVASAQDLNRNVQRSPPSLAEYLEDNPFPITDFDVYEPPPNGEIGTFAADKPKRKKDDPNFWINKHGQNVYVYAMDPKLSHTIRMEIQAALASLQDALRGCITFKQREKETNYVYFKSPNKAICNSYIGKVGGKQSINLRGDPSNPNIGCYVPSTTHEIMHSLGMLHIQNRPDRDLYIDVFEKNIRKHDRFNFELSDFTTYTDLYDFDSIMHYGSDALTIDPNKPSMTKKDGSWFTRNKMLSKIDILTLKAMYKCTDEPKPEPKTPTNGPIFSGGGKSPLTRNQGKYGSPGPAMNSFHEGKPNTKLAGNNMDVLKLNRQGKTITTEECAHATLVREGSSFEYSTLGGCYINSASSKTAQLSDSNTYTYYEMKNAFN